MKKFIALALTAAALSACATTQPPTQPTKTQAQSVQERNKANVLAFYDLAFNQHQPKLAVQKYVGSTYLQHNPTVADGGQAFVDAFAPFMASQPNFKATIHRAAAEGDLVWLHAHSQLGDQDRGEVVVDIFRLDDDGKIVEHWDVIQAVPEKTVSGRTMF